ncbi:hypothetical protein D3C71_1577960 [compost metagenome]
MQTETACIGQRLQQRVDARAVGAHGDDLHRRHVVGHVRDELMPVQATIMPADQQRDAATGEAFQRRQTCVRRGADRIVDEGDPLAHADGLQAVGQRAEVLHRRGQCHRVQAQRLDRRQHRAQVAAVVSAGQRRV